MKMEFRCEPDIITYNTILDAICKEGHINRASKLLQQMIDDGISPDVITYNSIINGLCKEKRVREAAQLLDKMPELGCKPDIFSYSTLIKGCCNAETRGWHLSCFRG